MEEKKENNFAHELFEKLFIVFVLILGGVAIHTNLYTDAKTVPTENENVLDELVVGNVYIVVDVYTDIKIIGESKECFRRLVLQNIKDVSKRAVVYNLDTYNYANVEPKLKEDATSLDIIVQGDRVEYLGNNNFKLRNHF